MKRILATLVLLLVPALAAAQNNPIADRPFGQVTLSFSATPTFNASQTDAWKLVLTGNVTSSTLSGAEAGQILVFQLCQDATGSRTFSPPSQFQNFTTISSSANVCTVEAGEFDGTNLNFFSGSGGGGGSGTVNSGTLNQCAKYVGTGTTVGGSTVCTDDGTTFTYTGTGGVSALKFTSTGAGAGALNATEGALPGGTAGHDILAADSISHAMQLSNNGGGFQPLATNSSTSPTTHGVTVGAGFPAFSTVPTGNSGQPFLSGGASADPGFGPLNLAGGLTFVTGILPSANLPTVTVYNNQANTYSSGLQDFSAVTFKAPIAAGAAPTTNGLFQYDSTSNNFHGGLNGADSRFASFVNTPTTLHCVHWVVTGGNVTLADDGSACGAGASVAWNGITAATGGATTDNGDNAIIYRTLGTTSSRIGWRFTETSASSAAGTPFLHQIDTASGSTTHPLNVCAGGTTNCARFDKNSLLSLQGSATLAIPGTTHGIVLSEGATTATVTPATGTAGQVFISNGSGADPSFQDPIISQAYVNLFSAVAATGTATSSATRNPVFSQTGTLELTWASITGSPATCTLQIQGVDSLGNVLNNGSTFTVTPSNGTTSQTFTAASTLQTASQIKTIYACGTYPSTGTLSVDFTPIPNINVTNTVAVSAASLPLPTGASTSAKQPALGTAGAASADVITIQGIASMTKLLVTPDSVALPANQSVNVAQLAGTTTDTNSGNKSAGTLRTVIATDQPNLTTALNTSDAATSATGSAVPAKAAYVAGNGSGNATGIISCDNSSAINMSTGTTTQIVAISGTGGRTYICSISLVVSAADNVALISGSGSNCASNQAGLAGGTTAASGWNFAANGGLAQGSGLGMIFKTVTTNNEICLVTSATAQVSGTITWTQF